MTTLNRLQDVLKSVRLGEERKISKKQRVKVKDCLSLCINTTEKVFVTP